MARSPNYVSAAFLVPANILGLLSAFTASAITLQPWPAVVAGAVEALYLTLMATTPSFRRSVRARAYAEPADVAKRVDGLAASQQEHYRSLKALRDKILENYQKLPGGRVLAASSAQRLDALLDQFVRLVSTLNHYRQFLSSVDRQGVERELESLRAEIAADDSERLKEVKRRRVDILDRRLLRFRQAEESRELVSHQLAGIEDLLKLTHEQSIAIRDPESIAPQLEALTAEAQATEESVREMERFVDLDELSGPHLARVR